MTRHTFGILVVDDDVPGTLRPLQEEHSHAPSADIICLPIPTNDPNDPLTFKPWLKFMILTSASIIASLVAFMGPMVTTSYKKVAAELLVSLDKVTAAMSGYYSFAIGMGALVSAPMGVLYGKRAMFLAMLFVLTATSIWTYLAPTYTSLAFSRTVMGLAVAPIEILAVSVIADLFFVHQRGRCLAVVHGGHLVMVLMAQICGGVIVERHSWRMLFFIATFFMAACIPISYFCFLEPQYARSVMAKRFGLNHAFGNGRTADSSKKEFMPLERDIASAGSATSDSSTVPLRQGSQGAASIKAISEGQMEKRPEIHSSDTDISVYEKTPPFRTYRQRLALGSGRFTQSSYWLVFLRPVLLLLYPGVIFSAFVHGLGVTWIHAFGYVKLLIFSAPPYNLTTSQIGLTVLPAAVTSLIAHFISGYISDWLVTGLTRRNNGVYEPEFRLLLMIPQAIFSTAGFFVYGYTTGHGLPLWSALSGLALVSLSSPFGSMASFGYVVDTLEKVNQEAIVAVIAVKSIFQLLLADVINGWVQRQGSEQVFFILGAVNLLVSLCTIPFYVYGKILRHKISSWSKLESLVGLK